MVTPVLEPRLDPGESLRAIVAATYQKTFSGAMRAIGVTDRRLVFQPLDRKFNPTVVAMAELLAAAHEA
jgi:hypothetical protein